MNFKNQPLSQHKRHQPIQAFTLIELLVVISIVSLLISILLPALASARKSAMGVQCLTNIRQVGTGLFSYAFDNGGVIYKSYEATANPTSWANAMAQQGRYLPFPANSLSGPSNVNRVWVCPSAERLALSQSGVDYVGWNYLRIRNQLFWRAGLAGWGTAWWANLDQVSRTSEQMLLIDGSFGSSDVNAGVAIAGRNGAYATRHTQVLTPPTTTSVPGFVHLSESASSLFIDGHAQAMQSQNITSEMFDEWQD